MHTHEHIGFNASAQKYGHDVDTLDRYTDNVIQTMRKIMAKLAKPVGITQEMVDLTATTALEHFTATIASQLLTNAHIQELMTDETMKTMWLWHAIEENEHKAVAYDVFEEVFGKGLKAYMLRTSSLLISMATLFVVQSYFLARLLKQDQQLTLESFKVIYTYAYSPSKGIITGMAKEMLMYFKPRFHPNDHHTDQLLANWKAKLGF
jgi:predicted metal-dependent hydrolase